MTTSIVILSFRFRYSGFWLSRQVKMTWIVPGNCFSYINRFIFFPPCYFSKESPGEEGGKGAKYRKVDIHKINMSRLGAKDHLYMEKKGYWIFLFSSWVTFFCTLLTVCRKGQLRWNSWKYSFVEVSGHNLEISLRREIFTMGFLSTVWYSWTNLSCFHWLIILYGLLEP
jgi:hypothetical protein